MSIATCAFALVTVAVFAEEKVVGLDYLVASFAIFVFGIILGIVLPRFFDQWFRRGR